MICLVREVPDITITILLALRQLREVQLHEGLCAIGHGWFARSDVRKAVVPASVKRIEQYAFTKCRSLEKVTFSDDSALEKIDSFAFFQSALRSFEAPTGLRMLE